MFVRFWGTRGSLAKPGPTTVRYGGNTSCVEVRANDGTLFVLDCGTGAHALGESLLAEAAGRPLRGHVLITHSHWDHIQGFPFFLPFFAPNGEWDVYAPTGFGQKLQETLAGQMQYTYFPVDLRQLGATIRYHDMSEQSFDINRVRVTTRFLNHPALTIGYRLEEEGVAVVYATDHEQHGRLAAAEAASKQTGESLAHPEDMHHVAFVAGADLLIHDSQFTHEEYPRKLGYGHSTVDYVVDVAAAAKVRQLALFHHDITRTDDALDAIVEQFRTRLAAARIPTTVMAAAEGQTIHLRPAGVAERHRNGVVPPESLDAVPAGPTIVFVTTDAAMRTQVESSLAPGGFRLMAASAETVVADVQGLRPAVVLLDLAATDPLALRLCRELRAIAGAHLPIILSGSIVAPDALTTLIAAGATDYLTKPFSDSYLRSRGRAWLIRAMPHWISAEPAAEDPAEVRAMQESGLLDAATDERFDRITRLAARLFHVPAAIFAVVDAQREWVKSEAGALPSGAVHDLSLCRDAALNPEGLIVDDLQHDARFPQPSDRATWFRFFAGLPVHIPGGQVVGLLCIADQMPRHLSAPDLQALRDLTHVMEDELRAGRSLPEAAATH